MPDRFDRFTERARKVLTYAQEEAEGFHHNYIGTEHLLLGLVREEDGVAAKVLANLSVEREQVRSAVEQIIGRGDRMVMGAIGLTPRAKKVIELAVDEARRLNHHYVGTEHLLLGLVREGEGVGAGVLRRQGVGLEHAREEVLRVLAGTAEPRQWVTHEGTLPASGVRPGHAPAVLRRLLRVIPIAQTRQVEGTEITLLSLEVYAEGFSINGRLDREGEIEAHRLPEIALSATDDVGQEYQGSPCGGSGVGTHWRFCHQFGPKLPPTATNLLLRLEELRWRRPDPATSRLVVERSDPIGWTLTIPLQGT